MFWLMGVNTPLVCTECVVSFILQGWVFVGGDCTYGRGDCAKKPKPESLNPETYTPTPNETYTPGET